MLCRLYLTDKSRAVAARFSWVECFVGLCRIQCCRCGMFQSGLPLVGLVEIRGVSFGSRFRNDVSMRSLESCRCGFVTLSGQRYAHGRTLCRSVWRRFAENIGLWARVPLSLECDTSSCQMEFSVCSACFIGEVKVGGPFVKLTGDRVLDGNIQAGPQRCELWKCSHTVLVQETDEAVFVLTL